MSGVEHSLQVTVFQFDALSLVTLTQFGALSPSEYVHIWGTASHLVTVKLPNQ